MGTLDWALRNTASSNDHLTTGGLEVIGEGEVGESLVYVSVDGQLAGAVALMDQVGRITSHSFM